MASSKSVMVALCMMLAVSSAFGARDLQQLKLAGKLDLKEGFGFSYGYNLGWALGLLGFNQADSKTSGYVWGKGVSAVNSNNPSSNAQLGAGAGGAAGASFAWNLFGLKGSIGEQAALAAAVGNAANGQQGSTSAGALQAVAAANALSNQARPLDLKFQSALLNSLVNFVKANPIRLPGSKAATAPATSG